MIWNDAFAAEFFEQGWGEKDRHDRSTKGRDRCPRNRCAIIARAAAEERGDALEIIVRAVRVGEKASGKKKQNENHNRESLGVSNSSRRHNICCSLPWSRRSSGLSFLWDAAAMYASNRTASPRSTKHRQSDRRIRKTHDMELSCRDCRSCRKRRSAGRVPFGDCRHRPLPRTPHD